MISIQLTINLLQKDLSISSMWFGYDIPSHSHSVAETNITEFLDPRITVLFENHNGLKVGMDYGDYINDGDRDKFGYAILCGPRDIMTYESVQESNERFLDKFLGRRNSLIDNAKPSHGGGKSLKINNLDFETSSCRSLERRAA